MVDQIPVLSRRDRPGWDAVDEILYIMQINQNGTWDTDTMVGPGLQVKFGESGWLHWRQLDMNDDIVLGGSFPPDRVIQVVWGV